MALQERANELVKSLGDIAGRFDITATEADVIACEAVLSEDPEKEFVRIWKNQTWWQGY